MKFSIITITHNRAHLIGETIQSVIGQTHADFEHIIIDDGSTDATETVVKSYVDERIKYFKYPKNARRSFLRNEGIRKATGGAICILDSDDLWTNNKLEIVGSVFSKNPEVDFIIHNIAFFADQTGEVTQKGTFSKFTADFYKPILPELLSNHILPFSIFTIRRKTLETLGLLDETLVDGQHDLYLRAAASFKIYYCSQKLAHIRKHNQNISKNSNVQHDEDFLNSLEKLRKIGAVSQRQYFFLKSRTHYSIAKTQLNQQQKEKSVENFRLGFKADLFSMPGLKSFLFYLKYTAVI